MRRVITLAMMTALASVAIASASRLPTHGERKQIRHVVQRQDAQPPSYYRLKIRISTVNPHWAGAFIRPKHGYEDVVQPDEMSLKHKHHRWHVIDVHSFCHTPKKVRKDLHLAGCF